MNATPIPPAEGTDGMLPAVSGSRSSELSREEKLALFHEEWDWWLNPRKTIRDLKEKLARENALAVRNDAVACEEMAKAAAWKCVAERLTATLERIIEDMDGSGDEIGAKQLRAHLRAILSENS